MNQMESIDSTGSGQALSARTRHGYVLAMQSGHLRADDWTTFVRLVRDHRETTPPLCITRSRGAYPNAAQRAALMDAIGTELRPHARIAVMTDIAIGRGIVTAMSWVVPGFKAFRAVDVDGALAHVGVAGENGALLILELTRLERRLGLRYGI